MIDWDADGRMWVVEMPGYMPDMPATTSSTRSAASACWRTRTTTARWTSGPSSLDRLVLPRALKVLDAACSSASRRTCGSCATPTAT